MPGMLVQMGLPDRVVKKAARQGGYVTRAQLMDSGLSESAISRRLGAGELIAVAANVYQVFPSNDHIDLIRGALLALPNAVASHESAAHLLEFPRLPRLIPTVTVASHTTHKFPGVTVRRNDDLIRAHLTTVRGVLVTNVIRTAFDVGALLDYGEFDPIVEGLILSGRMELRHFERITMELARRGKPGSRAARDFIELRAGADPRATVLERKGRGILAAAGLPTPIAQFPIPWDPRRRFDDAYPEAALAMEWDSRAWHEQRAAMASDRRRDREAAIHGWYLLRFTWEDVTKEPNTVATTVASLLRARKAVS